MSIALAYHHILHQEDELEALINGCSHNERGAQNKLYELFYPKMKAVVKRYCPDEDKAQEVLNRGFLRAFKKIDSFRFQGSFEGWLKVLFRHTVIDYLKENASYQKNILLVEKEEQIHKDFASGLYYNDLLKLVQSLPPTTRTVFNLFAIEGLSHQEIAKLINIKEGTSKWHMSEARKILKEKIEQQKMHLKK